MGVLDYDFLFRESERKFSSKCAWGKQKGQTIMEQTKKNKNKNNRRTASFKIENVEKKLKNKTTKKLN